MQQMAEEFGARGAEEVCVHAALRYEAGRGVSLRKPRTLIP